MILFHAHLEGNTPSDKYLSSTWCKAYLVNILLISWMKPRLWLSMCWKCVSLMSKLRCQISWSLIPGSDKIFLFRFNCFWFKNHFCHELLPFTYTSHAGNCVTCCKGIKTHAQAKHQPLF